MYKKLVYLFVSISLLPQIVFAQNAQTMIVNLAQAVPNFTRMVTAIAYVLGMYMVIKGILELKTYGEGRTMYSTDKSLKPALVYLTIGALLIFLPSSVQVGLSTFWNDPCPYCYINQTDQWTMFLANCFMIIQFIGVVTFIRGLIIFSHLAHGQGQPQTFSKALTHVIGGIFCINIYQFIQLVLITFGINYQVF